MRPLWQLSSSIAQQECSTGSSAGRDDFGTMLYIASARWSLRYGMGLSGPLGKKNKYTSVWAGNEDKTVEHSHRVD